MVKRSRMRIKQYDKTMLLRGIENEKNAVEILEKFRYGREYEVSKVNYENGTAILDGREELPIPLKHLNVVKRAVVKGKIKNTYLRVTPKEDENGFKAIVEINDTLKQLIKNQVIVDGETIDNLNGTDFRRHLARRWFTRGVRSSGRVLCSKELLDSGKIKLPFENIAYFDDFIERIQSAIKYIIDYEERPEFELVEVEV